jgi:hypothetical protein
MARAVAYMNSEGLARRADVPPSRRADIVWGSARDSASVGTDGGRRAGGLLEQYHVRRQGDRARAGLIRTPAGAARENRIISHMY